MAEVDDEGALTARYYRGVGLVSRAITAGTETYVTDGHGDVVQLVNAAGTVTQDYRYDAWGNQAETAEEDTNPFRYAGEYWDAETNSIYLRARYYDPRTGRFTSEDTYWNPSNMIYGDDAENKTPLLSAIMQSGNLYVYCGNNPINRWDPIGNDWTDYTPWEMQKSAQRAV